MPRLRDWLLVVLIVAVLVFIWWLFMHWELEPAYPRNPLDYEQLQLP